MGSSVCGLLSHRHGVVASLDRTAQDLRSTWSMAVNDC